MDTTQGALVITGAAGRIGSSLREPLRDLANELVLVDRVAVHPRSPTERAIQLDLTDLGSVVDAFAGADSVVHLAGIPDEAPFPDLLEANVLAVQHVLEAARRQRVRRVVLASSNRVTGFHPVGEVLTPDAPPRPDGLYGVSKVAVEALGRMYAEKFGLSVVCLRIGSFEQEPTNPRHLATWLSPRDCAGFVRAALTAPHVSFTTVYAVSANTRRFWDIGAGRQLGYLPVDDAEAFADQVRGDELPSDGPQSGHFAGADYTLPHLPTLS